MYKSKAKVDQQASVILSKVRDDDEKRLKGFQLGNLYFQAKDYEQAKKYVTLFLTAREQYAPAHKLMAQILERGSSQDDIKRSISYYKRAFELDDSQQQLSIKICSLYMRMELPPEQSSAAMYWVEKCKSFYPNEPVVFNLQEKLINQSLSIGDETQAEGGNLSNKAMEELLTNNLKVRPLEVSVRLKLLKCLERSQKLDTALRFIAEVMERSPYYENFDWYNYASDLLKYVTKQSDEEGWAVYLLSNLGAARTAIISRQDQEATDALKRLDAALHSSMKQTSSLISHVRDELKSQLLLLAANLLSRRTADQSHVSALYVAAFSRTAESVDIGRPRVDEHRQLLSIVDKLKAHRLTQSGYMVLSRAPTTDQLNWLRKLSQRFYNKDGKKRLYRLVFGVDGADANLGESLFMSELLLEQLHAVLPNAEELLELCKTAQALYPDSLHHQTWLALRQTDNTISEYILELIARLNFSPHRLSQYESESVSQVDMAVFLILTAYSARSRIEEHTSGRSALKVSDLTAALCSEEQAQWWSAVYESCGQVTPSAGSSKFGRQRQLLSKGIQVVRLADSHGLSVHMVYHVARLLASKLGEVKTQHAPTSSRVIHLTHWTNLYWTEAVKFLTALHRDETLPQAREKLFMSYDNELKPEEIRELLAEGRLWLALQLCEEDREDEALQELIHLPQPLASYTAAQIYRSRADSHADSDEGRQALLVRSQECLHLTVDRLATDRSNPLNAAVERELERLEGELESGHSFLTANDSVVGNGHNGNGSFLSTPVHTTRGNNRGTPANGQRSRGTPHSINLADLSMSARVRPSPERLELQVRSIASAQESLRATIHEERDIAMETSKQMVDSVTQILNSRLGEIANMNRQLSDDVRVVRQDLGDLRLTLQQVRSELADMKTNMSQADRSPPGAMHVSSSETQVNFLQQQLTALTAMMATALQHPALHPAAAASLSGYGTPARGTPPVYQHGFPDMTQLGTYPHIPQQHHQSTPSRLPGTPGAGGGLTQQEMAAAALAAVEHGYDDREYYVDDGENYYGGEYEEPEDYTSTGGYVGAEGSSTIAYMPKTSASGKAMPQPGFFAQPDKTQTKLAEPKPAEQGVAPNVVMNKEMMSKESAKQKPATFTQSPLVVNVPITPTAAASSPTQPSTGRGNVVPPSPSKSESGEHNSSHDPQFEPIIELPPEVAVVTGEEDEDVLFEARAKLFRFVNNEWKERGIGPIKLLERKDNPGKCRLVMRRDQVHKVCANHAIHQTMSLVPMGDKGNAWIWTATDYTEADPSNERLAIRFKTADLGADFKKAFDEAREKTGRAMSSSQPSDSQPSDGQLSGSQPNAKSTPKTKTSTDSEKPTLSELFKPANSQWKCVGCYCSNDVGVAKCPACGTMQPGVTEKKPEPAAANIQPPSSTGFGGFPSFTFPPSTTKGAAPPSSTPLFSGSQSITFGASPVVSSGQSILGSGGIFGKPNPAISDITPSDSATTSGTATPTEEASAVTSTAKGAATSLFGTKAVDTVPTQPTGLFTNLTQSNSTKQESEESGSILRQLLSVDSSAPAAKPAEKFSMGGFTFNAPPQADAAAKASTNELAVSKPSLFAGFAGFSKQATSTPSTGFGFSVTATSGGSLPFAFTPPVSTGGSFATATAQNLSDLKQSSSAPQLSEKETVSMPPVSTDDSTVRSPAKGSDNPEEECSAEFQPVIDLPDLVAVSTGEEDEEKLFGERCKLFRMVDGQWKERGVGELKILCHNITKAIRLIMRREQVLKLCANHKLMSGMKLGPAGEKARMWAAQDFSDGELRSETFYARFKTPDLAQEFDDVFTEAVETEAGESGGDKKETSKPGPASPATKPAPSGSTLAELFKPKEGEWSCSTCTVKNAGVNQCACCGTAKPGSAPSKPSLQAPSGTGAGFGAFKFPASNTGSPNVITSTPGLAPLDLSKMSFGGVKIGQAPNQLNDLNKPSGSVKAESSINKPTVLESPGKYVEEENEGDHIHFEPVIDLPDLVEVKTGEEDETVLYIHRAKLFRYANGEFKERGLGDVKILKHNTTSKVRLILRREKILKLACNHLITPAMTLRPMESAAGKAWIWYAVDFSEGTQSEEMYAIRFKSEEIANEFKACFDAAKNNEDVPEQKLISVTTETPKKCRSRPPSESQSVSSVSSSVKPALAAPGSISGTPSGGTSVFGGSQQSPVRSLFSNAASTEPASGSLFGNMATSQSPSSSIFGNAAASQSPAATLFGNAAAANKSKIPVFGGKSTPGTPPSSSVFGGATNTQPPSSVFGGKGVFGASPFGGAASPLNSVFGSHSATPPSSTSTTAVTFGAKPTPQALFGGAGAKGLTSVFGGTSKVSPSQDQSEENDVVYICENRPSEELVRRAKEFLLPSGHYLYEKRKPCKGCIGCEKNEDAILDHLFYNKPYTKNIGLSPLVKNTRPPQPANPSQEAADASGFAAYASATDFSSLSEVSSDPNAFHKSEGFKWSGAGKTLFGGGASAEGKHDDNPEAFEAEAMFKPVLDVLPDLVDTKTGEEDEEKLFCHRAKLFRFDDGQWKERGIGEMKLLMHHKNGTVRILLRREQVLKLVCNHQVQPDMDLKPMSTSETAWCWFATDYSDNSIENKVEQFAVRFKNIEVAKQFKEKFDDAKEFVKLSREAKTITDTESSIVNIGAENGNAPQGDEASGGPTYEQEDDEYDDDSDEEIKVLFERQITLLEKQGGTYQSIGMKQIQVVEETMDIIGGIAIYINNISNGNLEHRQLIFQETEAANVNKTTCVWQMHDFLPERPLLKRFQAKFSSVPAAKEFATHVAEGITYAKTMKLSETEAIRTSMATNPTEIDLSGAVVGGHK